MVRLKDVAGRAGVSLMTVSKVLRDATDVSKATKTKVRQIAEEMGYVPDASAQGLRTRRTRLFGLVLPSLSHALLSQAALGIEDRAVDLGYDLLIGQTQGNPQREELSIRRLLARRIDGLFVYPVYRLSPTAPIYDELQRSGTPVVLLGGRALFCQAFSGVAIEESQPCQQLVHHLTALGHRQIAFLAGPPTAPWALAQLDGYRRGLRDAGIAPDDRLVFASGVTVDDGRHAASQLLDECADVTAIMTSSDFCALGVAAGCAERGLRIPEDISLTGFGDHLVAEHSRVPLTTVRQPKYGLGLAAIEYMVRLLRGEKPEGRLLNAEIVIRASTAVAKVRPASPSPLKVIESVAALGDDLQ